MNQIFKINTISTLLVLCCLLTFGQSERYTSERAKGDAYFFKGNYIKALKYYKKHEVSSNMFLEESFLHRYSESYYMLGLFDKAIACYNRSYQRGDKSFNVDFYKQLASRCSTPSVYLAHIPNLSDSLVVDDKSQYYLVPAHMLNSQFNEFGAIAHDEKIFFATNRSLNKRKDKNTQKSHYDLYSISNEASVLPENIDTLLNYKELSSSEQNQIKVLQDGFDIQEVNGVNSRFNDGPISFLNDTTVFFTRNERHRVSKNSVFNLTVLEGKMKSVNEVKKVRRSIFGRFFSPGSVGHISFSPSGKRAVMVANSEHTIGNSDLWFSDLQENGEWGTPYGAGNDINTTGDEMFPFWQSDSLLFFASDGHKGYGGLDNFKAKLVGNNKFKVFNVGNVINSEFDDFSLSISSNNVAMFTSNRSGGRGADDIYFAYPIDFQEKVEKGTIQIELISDAIAAVGQEFYLMMGDSIRYNKFDIGVSPSYAYQNLDYGDYTLLHNLENDTIYETVHLDSKNEIVYVEFQDQPDSLPVQFTNFNFDTYGIAEIEDVRFLRLVSFLKKNSDLKVKLEGHTDQFGSLEYNTILGMNRCKTMEYFLTQNGVTNSIEMVSKGNTELVSKVDHRLNRRVDVILYEPNESEPLSFIAKGNRHCSKDLFIVYNHAEQQVSPLESGFYVKFFASFVHRNLQEVAKSMKIPQNVKTFVYSTNNHIFRHYVDQKFDKKEDAIAYARSLNLPQFMIHFIN